MGKFRILLILISFSTVSAWIAGCAGSKDEMSRAQQEIDTRQYQSAIERLEHLGQDAPSIRNSEEYIDQLSSAYLGNSGVDLISALGQWAETAKNLQGAQSDLNIINSESATPVPFQKFKIIVNRLIPPELGIEETPYLQKALILCNDRLKIASQGATISERNLVKTVFANFWAFLNELKLGTIPAVEKLISTQTPPDICGGLSESAGSLQKVTEYVQNIAMSATLLGDQKNSQIESISNLSKITESLGWLKQYSSCEHISNEEIAKIKRQLSGS